MINENVDFSKWNSKASCFEKYKDIKTKLIYGEHNPQAKVSIIILSYRRVDGLIQALESAINQDYDGEYEILVMDDSGLITQIDDVMKKYCTILLLFLQLFHLKCSSQKIEEFLILSSYQNPRLLRHNKHHYHK